MIFVLCCAFVAWLCGAFVLVYFLGKTKGQLDEASRPRDFDAPPPFHWPK